MLGSINVNMCSCESICVFVLKYDSCLPDITSDDLYRVLFCCVVVRQ